MEEREIYISFVILLNAILDLIHGVAHFEVQVLPGLLDTIFISLVIGAAPLIALLAILRGFQFYGGLLLFLSMVASLIYGLVHHFLVAGADNALTMPDGGAGSFFLVSSLLLLVTEIVGGWIAATLIFRNLQGPRSKVPQDDQ